MRGQRRKLIGQPLANVRPREAPDFEVVGKRQRFGELVSRLAAHFLPDAKAVEIDQQRAGRGDPFQPLAARLPAKNKSP